MSILAIIPARGGSKGIPRKNVRLIGGKPLIAYSIEQARQTPSIGRVVVSTDDSEISAVARGFGAEVVARPAEISGDTASSESALAHALEELRAREGYDPELVVFLQPTSPLRKTDDIENAIRTLKQEGADSLFSGRLIHGFIWSKTAVELSSFNYDFRRRPRRQELAAEHFEENGSIYVFKPWVLRELNNRLGGKVAMHPMDPLDSFQVDEPEDLELMSSLLAIRQPPVNGGRPRLAAVQLLALDFDGVMTDNTVMVDANGLESVGCHRGDGWGIARLKERGVTVIVVSTEKNPVVAARCRKLAIACIQGCDDKLTPLRQFAKERGFSQSEIAYLGNDVNDLDCLGWAGIPLAVADSHPDVLKVASKITTKPGGRGAVREVTDWILASKQNLTAP